MKANIRSVAFAIASIALMAGTLRAQTIVYVDDDAAAGGNGASWATAFRYLQDAIAFSPTSSEIHIAGGLQRPDLGAGVLHYDWDASFKPKSGMVLKGGYRGLAAGGSPDDRDLVAFQSVISGDLISNDPTSYIDNSYHLFEITGAISSVTLDGMLLHAGRATSNTTVDQQGGGVRQTAGNLVMNDLRIEQCAGVGGAVYFAGGTVTITNCVLDSCSGEGAGVRLNTNTAVIDSCSFLDCGGSGVIYAPSSTVTIRNSRFETTTGALSAAIYSVSSSVLVEDSQFLGFTSGNEGGAAFLRDSLTTIRRSLFRDNYSGSSGGAILAWYGTLEIEDSVFDGNEAYGYGGAILSRYADPTSVRRCTLSRNRAHGGRGGGIWVEQIGLGAVSIQDCLLASNGAQFGGGVALQAVASIQRCAFSANQGVQGGGGLQVDTSPAGTTTVDHCTFYGNEYQPGSALRTSGTGSITVTNTLMWNNQAPQIQNLGATLGIAYCDVESLPAAYIGNGNFELFPWVYAPPIHDFHLRAGSPCIDTGDPNAALDSDGTRTDVGAVPFEANYSVPPTTYCTAGTSTVGCNATMGAIGTASATAASSFTITVSGLEGQKTSLVFYGTTGVANTPWGPSSSSLCVTPPLQRTPAQDSGGSSGVCDGGLSVDWNTFLSSVPGALGSPFDIGDVVWAQCWYRDPPSPKTTQLSNGLQFVIEP
jgi:predicted outer membrane repeat protein